MADLPEAACLLQTGTQYHRRLGLKPPGGDLAFAGFKPGAFSVYFGDAPIYHFDLEGRWQRAFVAGIHYVKGLDGGVAAIDRVREGKSLVLKRRSLPFAEARDLDDAIWRMAMDVFAGMGTGTLGLVSPPEGIAPIAPAELLEFLERIARWDAAAWFAQREKYLGTYGVPPFLPPDGQNAMILQATLGHADGTAFGGAAPAEFHVRTASEFAEHVREVAALFGRRVEQCRGIFLGGPDALRQPISDVAAWLEAVARVVPIALASGSDRLSGVFAFLDQFSAPVPDAEGWRRLKRLHLRRVYLGVESGLPEVRAFFGKTWEDASLRATVTALKEAGIEVGLIVLAGAGGLEGADREEAATAALLNGLVLGKLDVVALVSADEVGGVSSLALLETLGRTPLTGPTRAERLASLRGRLAPTREKGVKVVPYSMEKQGAG